MNRLVKPRPSEPPRLTRATNAPNTSAMSRTMQVAVNGMKPSAASRGDEQASASLQGENTLTWFSAPVAATPRTKVEQYWAARTLVAETLLSAHDRHQSELTQMRRMEEQKREREIGIILHANDQRQGRLERLMVLCLAVLLGFVCWVVMMIAPDRDAKSRSSKASHFTIPILSPFASVVEHETGVFGAKAVAVIVLVIGIALYAALKYRFSQWHTR